MKSRIFVALMLICLLVLTGCAKAAQSEVALDQIVNENGMYAFPGYEWGMEKADLQQALGYPLDKSYNTEFLVDDGSAPVDENNAVMMADEENRWHTIEGTPFYAAYQFSEGKLVSIQFGHDNFDRDNRKKVIDFVNYPNLAEKLVASITAQIGEPDVKYDVDGQVERPQYMPDSTVVHYVWNNEESDSVNWISVAYSVLNDISEITITATKAPA